MTNKSLHIFYHFYFTVSTVDNFVFKAFDTSPRIKPNRPTKAGLMYGLSISMLAKKALIKVASTIIPVLQ
jgi:hypothetical protein